MNAKLSINLANIKHNYFYAKNSVYGEKVFAVIKTNAYGLGVKKISKFLNNFVDGFAVATLKEALDLITEKDILLMMGCFSQSELKIAIQNNFIITIATKEQAETLIDLKDNKKIKIFLKYDSGMSRLGLDKAQFITYYTQLNNKKNIDITMMSHFSCSENKNISNTQVITINHLKNQLGIKKTSFLNSAGILNNLIPNSINRLGISLYGINLTQKSHDLKPAISLFAPIIAIKKIQNGNFIGYGQSFRTIKDMTIAVVKIGYGDGYPRNIDKATPVFINGSKSIIVGRVSMDMITIVLNNIDANIGDYVEFFGENIDICDIANSANTIPYELFCNISTRVKKSYF